MFNFSPTRSDTQDSRCGKVLSALSCSDELLSSANSSFGPWTPGTLIAPVDLNSNTSFDVNENGTDRFTPECLSAEPQLQKSLNAYSTFSTDCSQSHHPVTSQLPFATGCSLHSRDFHVRENILCRSNVAERVSSYAPEANSYSLSAVSDDQGSVKQPKRFSRASQAFSSHQVPEQSIMSIQTPGTQSTHTDFVSLARLDCRDSSATNSPSGSRGIAGKVFLTTPDDGKSIGRRGRLRAVTELPTQYRALFDQFPFFNIVQSTVFDDVFNSDQSIVVCAPTGSGKTVIMELAILRELETVAAQDIKIIYVAPLKAVVGERCLDWGTRLSSALGLSCVEVTGDTDTDDYLAIRNAQVILTTPEKLDSVSRRWRDRNTFLLHAVSLLLIDEIHVLGDPVRGPIVEAVVSRLKTILSSAISRREQRSDDHLQPKDPISLGDCRPLRIVAVSATIPNVGDVAAWIGGEGWPAKCYKLGEELRPVQLRKVVLGYPCPGAWSEYRFDISLTYKLPAVIASYSDGKPTLVFVSTRKGCQQSAQTLVKQARFVKDSQLKAVLTEAANSLIDCKLRECLLHGVAYHHAGIEVADRRLVETLFTTGQLPVLISTSTLAMGVNLPAHLVVIKSTTQYTSNGFEEYPVATLLQMMGRAGRPQFDSTATAVIMTTNANKRRYEQIVTGTSPLESHLHQNLIEHINAEIVLGSVTDESVLLTWLRSTFLFVRAQRNPRHYNCPQQLPDLLTSLSQLCRSAVQSLVSADLVTMSENGSFVATKYGALMARYYLSFRTMIAFMKVEGDTSLFELLDLIASSNEFSDVKLRTSEKKIINELNKGSNLRFPLSGKIKNRKEKILCLIQSIFGCHSIPDSSLSQEANKIMRVGQRLAKCMREVISLHSFDNHFEVRLNSTLLSKSFSCRLWEHSRHVVRQLRGIGPALANALHSAKVSSFTALESTNPRDVEMICSRLPPFGNNLKESVRMLPRYHLTVRQLGKVEREKSEVEIEVSVLNCEELQQGRIAAAGECPLPLYHCCLLLVGDAANNVLVATRCTDAALLKAGKISRVVTAERCDEGEEISINYLSETWAGLDIQCYFVPRYATAQVPADHTAHDNFTRQQFQEPEPASRDPRRPCCHTCNNKLTCAHACCKVGVRQTTRALQKSSFVNNKRLSDALSNDLQHKRLSLEEPTQDNNATHFEDNFGKHVSVGFNSATSSNKERAVNIERLLANYRYKFKKPKLYHSETNILGINLHSDIKNTDSNKHDGTSTRQRPAAARDGGKSSVGSQELYSKLVDKLPANCNDNSEISNSGNVADDIQDDLDCILEDCTELNQNTSTFSISPEYAEDKLLNVASQTKLNDCKKPSCLINYQNEETVHIDQLCKSSGVPTCLYSIPSVKSMTNVAERTKFASTSAQNMSSFVGTANTIDQSVEIPNEVEATVARLRKTVGFSSFFGSKLGSDRNSFTSAMSQKRIEVSSPMTPSYLEHLISASPRPLKDISGKNATCCKDVELNGNELFTSTSENQMSMPLCTVPEMTANRRTAAARVQPFMQTTSPAKSPILEKITLGNSTLPNVQSFPCTKVKNIENDNSKPGSLNTSLPACVLPFSPVVMNPIPLYSVPNLLNLYQLSSPGHLYSAASNSSYVDPVSLPMMPVFTYPYCSATSMRLTHPNN